ncbi:MAG: hydrogenase [Planctomycetota bacterium]|nr:hydrogenase [Planctomycetota bacterium]
MSNIVDPCMVLALLLNFYLLGVSRLRMLIFVVALQGVLLGLMYPIVHQGFLPESGGLTTMSPLSLLRLALLTAAIMGIKGLLIPKLLFKAILLADIRTTISSVIGFVPTLLLGGIGTGAALIFAQSLPLPEGHQHHLLIPAAFATVLAGFLMLVTRREALGQVLGYIVMENGIFIFGLLLIEAVPLLVEFGVVLDLFVGVFVMGIMVNHVSRAFPEASTEHLTTLRE